MKALVDAYSYLEIDVHRLKFQALVARNMFRAMRVLPDSTQTLLQTEMCFSRSCLFNQTSTNNTRVFCWLWKSFSTMRWVKTYLRSTMGEHRLSNLCLLSTERSLSGKILANPNSAINAFAASVVNADYVYCSYCCADSILWSYYIHPKTQCTW